MNWQKLLAQIRFQQFAPGAVTQPTDRLLLDLADTLTSQTELLTDLLEGHLRTTDPEEVFDDITFPIGQCCQCTLPSVLNDSLINPRSAIGESVLTNTSSSELPSPSANGASTET